LFVFLYSSPYNDLDKYFYLKRVYSFNFLNSSKFSLFNFKDLYLFKNFELYNLYKFHKGKKNVFFYKSIKNNIPLYTFLEFKRSRKPLYNKAKDIFSTTKLPSSYHYF
jgi:hypothetical protein